MRQRNHAGPWKTLHIYIDTSIHILYIYHYNPLYTNIYIFKHPWIKLLVPHVTSFVCILFCPKLPAIALALYAKSMAEVPVVVDLQFDRGGFVGTILALGFEEDFSGPARRRLPGCLQVASDVAHDGTLTWWQEVSEHSMNIREKQINKKNYRKMQKGRIGNGCRTSGFVHKPRMFSQHFSTRKWGKIHPNAIWCNMLQYVAVQCYGLFHPHLSLGRLWHYSPLLQKIVAHCDAFRLDHTSQSQNVSNLHWSHVRTSCMKWNCFYIYHENQWNSMSNLNNYECFIFCSTSIDVLFDFLLCWSWPKAPLWRIQRVPSGPRFPMYLARLPGGEHKKGPTTSNTKQNFRTKQIGNKCAWSAGKVLRVVVCKRLSYHVISVINKFAFLGKSSRVDLLMCVSGRGAVVA